MARWDNPGVPHKGWTLVGYEDIKRGFATPVDVLMDVGVLTKKMLLMVTLNMKLPEKIPDCKAVADHILSPQPHRSHWFWLCHCHHEPQMGSSDRSAAYASVFDSEQMDNHNI